MNGFSMFSLGLVVALVCIHISLISTFPVGDSPLYSAQKRADICGLFDTDPSCLSNGDLSFSMSEADSEGVIPNEVEPVDDLDSYESSGPMFLVDDYSSKPSLDTNIIATVNLNLDSSQSQIDRADSKTQPELLPDGFLDETTTDQAESISNLDFNAARTGQISQRPRRIPVIYTFICNEVGEACMKYADGVPTGEIVFAKCNNNDQLCRLCDSSGKCLPDAGWDKQAIPSPDNPYGQPWNYCRNKQCGGCEAAAGFFGFLSLGVIPGCGPPKFD